MWACSAFKVNNKLTLVASQSSSCPSLQLWKAQKTTTKPLLPTQSLKLYTPMTRVPHQNMRTTKWTPFFHSKFAKKLHSFWVNWLVPLIRIIKFEAFANWVWEFASCVMVFTKVLMKQGIGFHSLVGDNWCGCRSFTIGLPHLLSN